MRAFALYLLSPSFQLGGSVGIKSHIWLMCLFGGFVPVPWCSFKSIACFIYKFLGSSVYALLSITVMRLIEVDWLLDTCSWTAPTQSDTNLKASSQPHAPSSHALRLISASTSPLSLLSQAKKKLELQRGKEQKAPAIFGTQLVLFVSKQVITDARLLVLVTDYKLQFPSIGWYSVS